MTNTTLLIDLQPRWIVRHGRAEGLVFRCPLCKKARHSHSVTWEQPSMYASGAVWYKTGSTFADISLAPSIYILPPGSCTFHGSITAGMVHW